MKARGGRNAGHFNRRATQRKGKLGRHIRGILTGRGTNGSQNITKKKTLLPLSKIQITAFLSVKAN
jgi:hypothetical protein